jgi:hypothetical protein
MRRDGLKRAALSPSASVAAKASLGIETAHQIVIRSS